LGKNSRTRVVAIIICCAVLSAGCLTIDSVIAVQPDGIGSVTYTLFLKSTTIESLEKFAQTREDRGEAGGWKDFFSDAKWRQAASTMGEGVTFQSLQKVKKRGWEGVKVVYFFNDISKLTLKMGFPSVMSLTEPAPAAEALTFRFTPPAAAPANLTIVMPPYRTPDQGTSAATDGAPTRNAAVMARFSSVLDGFRASVVVDVNGPIVKTDADYVSGSKITILSVDFNEMMSGGADFGLFGAAIDGPLPADIREKLKTTSGLAMQVAPEANVEFGATPRAGRPPGPPSTPALPAASSPPARR
jgi:hypothetical protein